jgi:hypothetical protein
MLQPLLVKLLRMHLLLRLTRALLLPTPLALPLRPARLPTLPLLLQPTVQHLHLLKHRSRNQLPDTGRRNVARCVSAAGVISADDATQAMPESRYRLPGQIL